MRCALPWFWYAFPFFVWAVPLFWECTRGPDAVACMVGNATAFGNDALLKS